MHSDLETALGCVDDDRNKKFWSDYPFKWQIVILWLGKHH